MSEDNSTPNRMVKIASCLHLWEAELALARLAAEGLRGCLGNATFVLWFWQYSNAVGGVTLHVAECDVEQACDIVSPRADRATRDQPPWTCPACGQGVDESWVICWNCGTLADGTQPPAEDQHDAICGSIERPGKSDRTDLLRLAVLAFALVIVVSGDLLGAMTVWAILVVMLAWRGGDGSKDAERIEPDDSPGEPPPMSHDPAEESIQRRRRMGEAIALRAWHASVIGLFSFPPLLLYSAWLLWRSDRRKTPVGRRGRLRRNAAWTVSTLGILLSALFFLLLAESSYYDALSSYVDFTGDRPRW